MILLKKKKKENNIRKYKISYNFLGHKADQISYFRLKMILKWTNGLPCWIKRHKVHQARAHPGRTLCPRPRKPKLNDVVSSLSRKSESLVRSMWNVRKKKKKRKDNRVRWRDVDISRNIKRRQSSWDSILNEDLFSREAFCPFNPLFFAFNHRFILN